MDLKKKSERAQKLSLKTVSPYLVFAVEAVFIPILIKFLDKQPFVTCSADTDFDWKSQEGHLFTELQLLCTFGRSSDTSA